MVFRHRITCGRTKNAIDRTVVIAKPCQLHLDGLYRGTIRWINVIVGPVVIVRVDVRVVVVGVIVVRIIGKIIPWVIPGIEATPKPIDKNKKRP